jgi:hypothetical protein
VLNEPGRDEPFIGATGKLPIEPYEVADLGELIAALTCDRKRNRLVLRFGKAVGFLVMTKEDAVAMASSLLEQARKLKPSKGT